MPCGVAWLGLPLSSVHGCPGTWWPVPPLHQAPGSSMHGGPAPAASGHSLCSQLIFTLMVSGCSPQGSCRVFSTGKRKLRFLPLCLFLPRPPG